MTTLLSQWQQYARRTLIPPLLPYALVVHLLDSRIEFYLIDAADKNPPRLSDMIKIQHWADPVKPQRSPQ